MLRLLWLSLLLLGLSACAAPNPVPSATPTQEQLPTNTPSPTLTPLPERLGAMPEWNEWDVTVTSGQYGFQVTRAYTSQSAGSLRARNGYTFFVLEGIAYNFGRNRQAFFDTDFRLQIPDNDRIYEPSISLMQRVRRAGLTGNIDFPGENFITREQFIVGGRSWEETYVAYEIPAPVHAVQLRFGPASISPRSVIEIWFFEIEGSQDLRFYKAYDNGEALFEVDFDFMSPVEELGEVIDVRTFPADNCLGAEAVEHVAAVSQEFRAGYSVGAGLELGLFDFPDYLMPNVNFLSNISLRLEAHFDLNREEVLTFSDSYTLRTAAGSKSLYQITWYVVDLRGMMQVRLGGDNHYVPYTLTNRLRSQLEALTPEAC